MKTKFAAILLVGGLWALVGCNGGQTNPIASNQDFQNLVPLHSQVKANKASQEAAPTSPFQIDIEGDNDINFADFVEGRPGSVKFKVSTLQSTVQDYVLVPVTIPQGASFGRSNDIPDTWVLSWTAAKGTVPAGSLSAKFPIEIEALVIQTTDPRLTNFVDQAKPFEITVTKNEVVPTIVGVSQFKSKINEGEGFGFSVEVRNSSSGGAAPTLYRGPYNQSVPSEDIKSDGSTFVSPDVNQPVLKLPNGDWQYNLVLDTKDKDLPHADGNSDGVTVCFALSVDGNSAVETPLCTKVEYLSRQTTAAVARQRRPGEKTRAMETPPAKKDDKPHDADHAHRILKRSVLSQDSASAPTQATVPTTGSAQDSVSAITTDPAPAQGGGQ